MGSDTSVDTSKIRDNFIARPEGEDGWSGVYANDTSVAMVGGLEIIGNSNMQYCIAADANSTATVASCVISNNTGLVRIPVGILTMFAALRTLTVDPINIIVRKRISSPIFARNDSSISVFNTSLLDNFGFMVRAICQVTLSHINANQHTNTCLLAAAS